MPDLTDDELLQALQRDVYQLGRRGQDYKAKFAMLRAGVMRIAGQLYRSQEQLAIGKALFDAVNEADAMGGNKE